MLDQVKSGSSAGIATPARKPSKSGGQVALRVEPAEGAPAPGDENASGHPLSDHKNRRESDPQPQPPPVGAPPKVIAMSDDVPARRTTDNALQDLLAEARRLTPDDVPPATATARTPAPMAGAEQRLQKAVSAYSEQEKLDTRREKLRPGVIYSAKF